METFVLERSWKELVLVGGQYLVYRLDFKHGSGLVFFDIQVNEVTEYDFVWNAVAGGANVAFFAPQALIGGVPGVNTEILKVTHAATKDGEDYEEFPMVSQIFHGFNQPLDRVRWRFPAPQARGDLANEQITGPGLGQPFGWMFEGHESPFDNPTGRGMFINLVGTTVEFGLEHRTDRIVTPSSMWIENNLLTRPLDPSDDDDRATIVAILKNQKRAKYYSPGLNGVPYSEGSLRGNYRVEPVLWDGKTAITPDGVEVLV